MPTNTDPQAPNTGVQRMSLRATADAESLGFTMKGIYGN